MKIALVVPGFAADADDWCIPALTNLARSLAARPGVDLHVYALRYPPRPGTYPLHGATVHAFGGAPVAGRRIVGGSLTLLWAQFLTAIGAEHRRAPIAALHGFWATESGYLAALAGRTLGAPALVHLAGGELTADRATGYGNRRPGLARLLVTLSLRLASGLTVPASPMHRQLARHYPRYLAKAHPWAFGVDLDLFAPQTTDDGRQTTAFSSDQNSKLKTQNSKLRIVQAASLVPVKNQAALLDGIAAARTRAPTLAITATLVGQGPEEAALRAKIGRLGLGGVVSLAGERRHETLPDLYRQHDVFVLTSRHEAQCMAVLEAAACGLPWIGPPVGALADLAAQPASGGWLVPVARPDALAAALLAAADPEARRTRCAAVRPQVAQAYALETQTDRLLELYRHLIQRSGSRPLPFAPARR